MLRKFPFPVLIAILLTLNGGIVSLAFAGPGPTHTRILRQLEAQPIQSARLVYFDQSTADALGISLPPGRVGTPEFDQAVLKKLGYEIKVGAKPIEKETLSKTAEGIPYLFVEDDAFEGAGRAAFLEVDPDVWVNVKGIGITGLGSTQAIVPGPPSDTFTSHQDGSLTLEEAIKETLYARVADEQLSQGGSRVVAIIYTGRTIRYADGREVPLAIVVRAPLRRYDQPGAVVDDILGSLAEANSKRLLKGDFVNNSNLGSRGEWVDFGTMSFTEGFAPIKSSQNERFLFEGKYQATPLEREFFERELGRNLLRQMGIPVEHVNALDWKSDFIRNQVQELGHYFIESVYWVPGKSTGHAPPILLDFAHVEGAALHGNVRFHEFFRSAAENYFRSDLTRMQRYESEKIRLLEFTHSHDADLIKKMNQFLGQTHNLLYKIGEVNKIGDFKAYADQVSRVAHFKNRDLTGLTRPNVVSNAGTLADAYVKSKNPGPIGSYIENLVLDNRFETKPASDPLVQVTADTFSTKLYVRSFEDSGKIAKLFAYPEFDGAHPGEIFSFRVTTDGWKTHADYPAKFVQTAVGTYFEVEIPHGAMPVTEARVELTPFVREAHGNIRWLDKYLNFRGPPILLNERIGLPTSFYTRDGIMRLSYRIRTSIRPEDLVPGVEACRLLLAKAK